MWSPITGEFCKGKSHSMSSTPARNNVAYVSFHSGSESGIVSCPQIDMREAMAISSQSRSSASLCNKPNALLNLATSITAAVIAFHPIVSLVRYLSFRPRAIRLTMQDLSKEMNELSIDISSERNVIKKNGCDVDIPLLRATAYFILRW